MKKLVIYFTLIFSILIAPQFTQAHGQPSYVVKSGDTLWGISQEYGTSINSLKQVNNKNSNWLYVGERLTIPTAAKASVTASERDLLARLVFAEAEGEPYAGKVAVATVVLNRVDSPLFPNTIKGVIYQKVSGHYAFSPVKDKRIYELADRDSKRAVEEALRFRGKGSGSLYFYNPKTSSSSWIFSREVTVVIGNHRFAK